MPKPKWSEIPQGYDLLLYSPYENSWVAADENGLLKPIYYGGCTQEEWVVMQPGVKWNTRWYHLEERQSPKDITIEKLNSILEGIDWIKNWLMNYEDVES